MGAQTTEHDLTPSEVALARVLAAWEAWPGWMADGLADRAMNGVHEALLETGLITPRDVTVEGAALLARARKAGVL